MKDCPSGVLKKSSSFCISASVPFLNESIKGPLELEGVTGCLPGVLGVIVLGFVFE